MSVRRTHSPAWRTLALLAGLSPPLAVMAASPAGECRAASGERTTALVELYTSEGCSSCPPAEAALSAAAARWADREATPLALHVPYWDHLGWRDRLAHDAFAVRQRWLVGINGQRTVYTPHFFVSGRELRQWRDGLAATVADVNRRPAAARIAIGMKAAAGDGVDVVVDAEARDGAAALEFVLAITEASIVSAVEAGENRGSTLRHAHVVRAWLGPFALDGGRGEFRRHLPIARDWQRGKLALVGFVQDARSGEVLQSLRLPFCLDPA